MGFMRRNTCLLYTSQQKAFFQEKVAYPETQIFYESPHRVKATLENMLAVYGDRPVVLVRELTKIYEMCIRDRWLSGLYYADFISFYSPTQLCGGGTTKSNSNELPISVPLSR